MSIPPVLLILLLALFAGCSRDPARVPPIGEGYVGPMILSLREELTPKSPTVATVKHGDRLEIVQTRRRFARVRTSSGAEGWIDGRQLFPADRIQELRERAQQYVDAPSMGSATVHDALNVHTEPNRQSPSFHQIPERGSVEVLAHQVAPRVPYVAPPLIEKPKAPPPKKKKPRHDDKVEPPPMPSAPALPANWLGLSQTEFEPAEAVAPAPKNEPKPYEPPPIRMDDWSLIRTPEGKVGWVLSRALIMAIPDEVAQYAEGDRITSYFSLGTVEDEGRVKHNWLWTTISRNEQPYQFDGFRVFIYNRKRHRYETSYIERNVKGYYPVQAFPGGLNGSAYPAFYLIVEDQDGQLYKHTYEFQIYRVRMISKEPWTAERPAGGKPGLVTVASAPEPEKSVFGRIKEKLFGR